ncbi:hypothetical protein SAMN00808754_1412 [Thermanaeromonas toyohensis ToBE]|uniref:Uncharacterized protein n=1 Tax=Thermanaeromonas toyohensis ToBE TaxID=698762 RepID=A0A1W1VS98_9FIRM|nr:DUF6557 family protein [Thermanaeromonas toyohensis]SMB96153.1 hypothetical protein SAMN00808754_1412 [Thermanaeromonas toyohensis ToBE]
MLTVQDLFNRVSWSDVATQLVKLYPDQEENLPGYEKVFQQVRSCVPLPNDDGTVVHVELREEDDGERWYDVYGRKPRDDQGYALELCLFREWAGFYVDPELIERMPLPEIAAHVLWEMTFCGYSEEEILAHRREIEERMREYQEHPERAVPLSEVLGTLGQE